MRLKGKVAIVTGASQGIGQAMPQIVAAIQNDVIPTLLNTLQTQGPALMQQGLAMHGRPTARQA